MPLVIPPFVQYQGTTVPLRGLWNQPPPEGDRMVGFEILWGTTTGGQICVQFNLAGNSPVAMSQMVAFAVDNTRCGTDCSFVFPDSGYQLVVPSFSQGIFPIFSNALMFYALAPGAEAGDVTIFAVLNSNPPPVAIPQTQEQQAANIGGISLAAPGTVAVIPPGINGTLNAATITVSSTTGATGSANVQLLDGTGKSLWQGSLAPGTYTIPLTGLHVRFTNGVNFVVEAGADMSDTVATVNAYYTIP